MSPDGAQVYWRGNTPTKRYIELTSLRPVPLLYTRYTDRSTPLLC